MKSPIELLDNLLLDFKRLNPGVKGLDRDFLTVKHRFEHEGIGFLTLALPTLDEALLRGLATGRFTSPPGFKNIRKGAIPVFLQGMLCKVFDPVTGLLKEPIDYGIVRDVHTFLLFFKKTRLSSSSEDSLHEKAVSEFYQCDEVAEKVVIPDRHNHLIGLVGRSILLTLENKDLEDEYIYRHGPGAVQEAYKGNQKWSSLYGELRDSAHLPEWFGETNFRLSYPFSGLATREVEGPARHGPDVSVKQICPTLGGAGGSWVNFPDPTGNPELSSELGLNLSVCKTPGIEHRAFPRERKGHLQTKLRGASARLISVLKNSSSRRTITVEPFLRQYLQQGLNTVIRESISECRILRNCLALSDQSKNQKLALAGSLTGDWATIDLKSASDLLSVKLVESVFRYHPRILECMMDSRSPFIHTTDQNWPERELGKFAGMGNATTFPVQSICFAVICLAAIMDVRGTKPDFRKLQRASRLVRVYGDDIIVHKDYAHQVVAWLHDVGLKVNVKKSFLEGNFRESCGVEALRGVDITPLYLRHWPHQIGEGPNVCAHLVSLCNQLWMQGLYSTSNALKEHIESFLGSKLPLVSSQSGALGWHSRLDAIQPHKWCRATHQFLTRTFALAPVKYRDRLDGYAALLKCLTTPLLGRDKDHLERSTRRYQTRLVRRWVPSYSYDGLNLQA